MACLRKISTVAAGVTTWLAVLSATPAFAGMVTHNGATFEVVGTFDGVAGVTKQANFTYTADFTNWNADTSGTNPLEYIIAVEFSLTGNKVVSVDSFATTASGSWLAGASNSSNNNGCDVFGTIKNTACAEDLPFAETNIPPPQLTSGILTWTFGVTFKDILALDAFTKDDNHIGGFFRKCSGPEDDRTCTGGLGLSTTVSFTPDTPRRPPVRETPPSNVPLPGTLLLFGLGLAGLRLSRGGSRESVSEAR